MHPLRDFPVFAEEVRAKLVRGQTLFEDRNFSKTPVELLDEVQAELVDVMGWSYLLWSRLNAARHALERVEVASGQASPIRGGNVE